MPCYLTDICANVKSKCCQGRKQGAISPTSGKNQLFCNPVGTKSFIYDGAAMSVGVCPEAGSVKLIMKALALCISTILYITLWKQFSNFRYMKHNILW